MCLDKKKLEWAIIIEYTVEDVVASFKAIVFLVCAIFAGWLLMQLVNWLFALTLLIGVPLVYGLFWMVMYRQAFDSGALTLEKIDKDKNDPDGGND